VSLRTRLGKFAHDFGPIVLPTARQWFERVQPSARARFRAPRRISEPRPEAMPNSGLVIEPNRSRRKRRFWQVSGSR